MRVIGTGEKLANKLKECVEKHLHDERLSTEDLAHYLSMSRSQLHRRVRQLFNCSTTSFIRRIRLENAVYLLEEGDLTVSEIAYSTGFGSPSYFSSCFHDAFGYPPSEFRERTVPVPQQPKSRKLISILRSRVFILSVSCIVVFCSGWLVYPQLFPSDEVCIAVLNFQTTSDDKNLKILAEGISDEIRLYLARYPEIRVKSANSVREEGFLIVNGPEQGERLEVTHFIEGRIQVLRGTVTVFAKLIDTNEEIIWSEKFESTQNNISQLSKTVSKEVIRQLPISMTSLVPEFSSRENSWEISAMDLYRNGLKYIEGFHTTGQVEFLKEAKGCFHRALGIDPKFASCWVGIGKVHLWSTLKDSAYEDRMLDSVRYYAYKAMKLDPYHAEAYDLLSRYYRNKSDYESILAVLREGLVHNPNDAELCKQLGEYLTLRDETFIEGMRYMKKAARLEKGGEGWIDVVRSMGWSYCHIGDYDRSSKFFQLAGDLDPQIYYQNMAIVDFSIGDFEMQIRRTDSLCFENEMDFELCLHRYARSYYYDGKIDSAYHYLSELIKHKLDDQWNPEDTGLPWVAGFILYDSGYEKEGRALLKAWIDQITKDLSTGRNQAFFTGEYELAGIYAFLGERDKALEYLRRCEGRWFIIGHHSRFDTMSYWEKFRDDPEFRVIIDRVNKRKEMVRQEYDRMEAEGLI